MDKRCVDCRYEERYSTDIPCKDCDEKYSEFVSVDDLSGVHTFQTVLNCPLDRFRSVHWYAEYYTLREIFEILSRRNNADIAMLVADGWEAEPIGKSKSV